MIQYIYTRDENKENNLADKVADKLFFFTRQMKKLQAKK